MDTNGKIQTSEGQVAEPSDFTLSVIYNRQPALELG